MSGEESSARRRNFVSTRSAALDVKHAEPAAQDVDERAQLVVRGDHLARLPDGFQRELVLARHLGSVAHPDGNELAVGRGLDRLLGDNFHRPRRSLEEQPDGDLDAHVAVNADLAAYRELVLDEHGGIDDQVLHGHVLGLAQAAQLAEGKGEELVALVLQAGRGRLRRQVAGGVGLLGAVAQQDHAQQPLARLARRTSSMAAPMAVWSPVGRSGSRILP